MALPLPSRPVQNPLLGILGRLGAAAGFAVMAAMIKLGHAAGIHIVELVFYRFAFGLPPLIGLILLSRNFGAWRTDRPLAHLLRSALGLGTMALAFGALAYLPLAESTTIGFVAPLFSVILSALILRERVGRHRWSAVAAGLVGVLIVMQPGGSALPPVGLGLAIMAALGVAAVTITIRQIGRTESAATIVLWFSLLSMAISGGLMPFAATGHSAGEWAILAMLGLAGGAAQILLTVSLRLAPVAVVVPFDYSQLLWAVLLGWLIWQSEPPATTWAGAAIIIASALYAIYREQRIGAAKPPIPPLA